MPTEKIVDFGPSHTVAAAFPNSTQDVVGHWIAQTVAKDPKSGCLAIGPDGHRGL